MGNDLDVIEAQHMVNGKLRMLLCTPGNIRSAKMDRLVQKELLQCMEDRQMTLSEVCDVDVPVQTSCCARFCALFCGCCPPSSRNAQHRAVVWRTPEDGYAQARLLSTSRSDDNGPGLHRLRISNSAT